MRGANLGLKTALVVTPVNVLHNWRQEFKKWEPREFKPLRVYMLEDKSRFSPDKPYLQACSIVAAGVCMFLSISVLVLPNFLVILT